MLTASFAREGDASVRQAAQLAGPHPCLIGEGEARAALRSVDEVFPTRDLGFPKLVHKNSKKKVSFWCVLLRQFAKARQCRLGERFACGLAYGADSRGKTR